MAAERAEYAGCFMATDEQGGSHALHIFSNIPDAGTSDGPQAVPPEPELESIRTEDGRVVERIARGEYRTAAGVRLISDDPDAP